MMADDAKDPRLEFIKANEWSPDNPRDMDDIERNGLPEPKTIEDGQTLDEQTASAARRARQVRTPQEEATKRTRHKRAQRRRQRERDQARIAELESQNQRLRSAASRALERCEVATDPSGAADEAASILAEVVALDGTYVGRH